MTTNYKTLTLGKYADILAIARDETIAEEDKQIRILSVLTGVAEDDLLDLPIETFADLCADMRFLQDPCTAEPRMAKRYECGRWSLVPVDDLRRITTAQYIDFKTYAQEADKRVAEMLSCLLIPKGFKYNNGYDIYEVQQAIRDEMSVSDAVTLCAGFMSKLEELTEGFLISLMQGKNPKASRLTATLMEQVGVILKLVGDGLQM